MAEGFPQASSCPQYYNYSYQPSAPADHYYNRNAGLANNPIHYVSAKDIQHYFEKVDINIEEKDQNNYREIEQKTLSSNKVGKGFIKRDYIIIDNNL